MCGHALPPHGRCLSPHSAHTHAHNFLLRSLSLFHLLQERNGEVDERLVVDVRDEYQRLFASDDVKDLITMYDGAEEGARQLKERNYILGVLSNGSLKGIAFRLQRPNANSYAISTALQRDLGHIFPLFAFAVTEADKPDTTKFLRVGGHLPQLRVVFFLPR